MIKDFKLQRFRSHNFRSYASHDMQLLPVHRQNHDLDAPLMNIPDTAMMRP